MIFYGILLLRLKVLVQPLMFFSAALHYRIKYLNLLKVVSLILTSSTFQAVFALTHLPEARDK